MAVSARGPDPATQMASGQPEIQRPLGPGDTGEPGVEPHALEGSGRGAVTAGGTSRVWVLPQRLWNRGNGSSFSQVCPCQSIALLGACVAAVPHHRL